MWMTAVPARNTAGRPDSRGWLTAVMTAATGAYRTAPAVKKSQTKHTAPAAAACLLNRFQLACAMAAMRVRTIAVGLTGAAPAGSGLTAQSAGGMPDRALEAFLP